VAKNNCGIHVAFVLHSPTLENALALWQLNKTLSAIGKKVAARTLRAEMNLNSTSIGTGKLRCGKIIFRRSGINLLFDVPDRTIPAPLCFAITPYISPA